MPSTKRSRTEKAAIKDRFVPAFWRDADQRCGVVKEIKRRFQKLQQDTNADSAQKQMLCQRATFIAIQLETMETNAMEGDPFNTGTYTQAVNTLIGLLKALGLEKQFSEVGDLQSYLEGKDQ